MIVTIQIDTNSELSSEEHAVLAAIYGNNAPVVSAPPVTPKEIEEDQNKDSEAEREAEREREKGRVAEERKRAAAEKRAETKRKKEEAAAAERKRAAAEQAEDEQDEEPPAALEEKDEQQSSGEPTLKDAIALARTMIAGGKSAAVKSVLKDLGFSKVGELPEDKAGAFIDSLEML